MAGDPNDERLSQVVLTPIGAGRPWGPWATIGWTALCLLMYVVIQTVVAIDYAAVRAFNDSTARVTDIATNGNVVALATFASTPAVIGLVAVLVWVRGCPLRTYLALRWPGTRQFLVSLGGFLLLLAASDSLSYVLGRPIVPPVLVSWYRSSSPPLLLFAVLVVAPIGEETVMRGFLFQGIASSRWGPLAAILVSSLSWAALHVQYDLYGVTTVLATGLYLGAVRQRTASLLLTMVLHAVANAVATAELLFKVYHG